MSSFPFLSDEWVEAAKAVYASHADNMPTPPHQVRMNLIITEVPFGSGSEEAHMDTSEGTMKLDKGHIDEPELTVTLDYDTAKAILVEGNPQAGMQAFMAGKIKVQGDMTKLMAMQQQPADPTAIAIADEIKAITD